MLGQIKNIFTTGVYVYFDKVVFGYAFYILVSYFQFISILVVTDKNAIIFLRLNKQRGHQQLHLST
jgi:hypothetical protein